MKAIILAAGVGRRLGTFTDQRPKSLLRIGEKTLLQRHLLHLAAVGIEEITVVAGYLSEQIEAEIARTACSVPVRVVRNPLYRKGSALSVLTTGAVLGESPCILMDADLLYDRELLVRLIDAKSPNGLLVDPKLADDGEEVRVIADAEDRVIELGKVVQREGRIAGESVGIFKFDVSAGRQLMSRLKEAAEVNPNVEYEASISAVAGECELVSVSTDGLPWIEIDFPEDVERARHEIFPRIEHDAIR